MYSFSLRIDESLCRVDSEDDGGTSHLDDSILTSGGHPGERCETRATVEGTIIVYMYCSKYSLFFCWLK